MFAHKLASIRKVFGPRGVNSFRLYSLTYTEHNFSPEQEEKLLVILNDPAQQELHRLNVSDVRLERLLKWQEKNGEFKSLDDLLEVNGFTDKALQKFCKNVLEGNSFSRAKRSRRQYADPPIENAQDIQSAVGFYLSPKGVSWSQIIKTGSVLLNWCHITYETVGKTSASENYSMAQRILDEVPKSDAYVFESYTMPLNSKETCNITFKYSQIELASMLHALLNTSKTHNLHSANCVYHTKTFLSARLFKRYIGHERVSAEKTVLDMLANDWEEFPCDRVKMEQAVKDMYLAQKPMTRELLGQSLLLAVAFMNVCVDRNPVSLDALKNKKRSVVNDSNFEDDESEERCEL